MGRPNSQQELTCEQCKGGFKVPPSEVRRGRKYCSDACRAASNLIDAPDRDELVHLYVQEALAAADVGSVYGVSRNVVYRWLKCYGIPLRTHGEVNTVTKTGKKHTEEAKGKIAAGTAAALPSRRGRQRGKGGFREDIGRYVRSRWEANYCRYLNHLQSEGKVSRWDYEPTTFTFPETRGARSYLPDFLVIYPDGSEVYVEVKGYEKPEDRTKWRRLKKHYPDVKLVVVGADAYRAICSEYGGLPNWEKDRTKYRRVRQFYPDVKLTIIGAAEYRALCSEYGELPKWERQERTSEATGEPTEKRAMRKRAKG